MSSDPVSRLLLAIIAACAVALTAAQLAGGGEGAPVEAPVVAAPFQFIPMRPAAGKTYIVRADQRTGDVDLWQLQGPAGWQPLKGTLSEARAAAEAASANEAAPAPADAAAEDTGP